MRSQFHCGDQDETVELATATGDAARPGLLRATVGERAYDLCATETSDGQWILDLGERRVRARVVRDGDSMWVHIDGMGDFRFGHGKRPSGRRAAAAGGDAALSAGMTSQVVEVLVSVGDRVTPGDPLVVLEAMKMESRIAAPIAGTVTAVRCTAGEVVEAGVLLVELEPSED